jgi:hypothetical protein
MVAVCRSHDLYVPSPSLPLYGAVPAPHQLRHAHAVEMAYEVPLNVIER